VEKIARDIGHLPDPCFTHRTEPSESGDWCLAEAVFAEL